MVIVDTCVWSEALRKQSNPETEVATKLKKFISDGQVVLLNPIRQELLSGIKEKKTFEKLKVQLRVFPGLHFEDEIYEIAADCFNQCRKVGIQGSNTDFLICAAAIHFDHFIFTTDQDFLFFKKQLPIKLI